jgi:hypothetical protein
MRLYSLKKLVFVSAAVGFATLISAQAQARPRLLARIFGGRPVYTRTYDSGNVVTTQTAEGERRSFSYEPSSEPSYERMPASNRMPASAPWNFPKSDPRRYR